MHVQLITVLLPLIGHIWGKEAGLRTRYSNAGLWRSDNRCGPNFPLADGTSAKCRWASCCSNWGWCGNSDWHCKCPGCIDFTALAAHWSYGSEGPSSWHDMYKTCGGKSQSPINIDNWVTSNVPCQLHFTKGYYNNLEGTWKNNGHSLQFTLRDGSKTQLSGHCIKGIYQLSQIHAHWGSKAGQGSEHTIHGRQKSLEVHMVHMNTKYSPKDAANHPDGYLVVGILFDENIKAEKYLQSLGLDKALYEYVVQSKKTNVVNTEKKAKFSVGPFLALSNVERTHYQYHGSLTTPGCNEVVTWVLATRVLGVSPHFMSLLRQLKTDDGKPLVDNFRPVQQLNGRVITLWPA